MMSTVSLAHFSDPHCPWAYSASPAHAVLRWRFGAQLDWRLVLIGLSESPDRYVKSGYTPARSAQGFRTFGRRCRLVVAARLRHGVDAEFAVFRALQLAQFTTTLLLDAPADLQAALEARPIDGVDAAALVAAIADEDVEAAYQEDRARSRTAAGSPTEAQGREANTDGAVRYTAPSIIFETADGQSLEVGGFQPVEAYDTALANLDVSLERRPAAEDPVEVVSALPYAPVTREVAACMTTNLDELDEDGAERALIAAAAEGRVRREAVGTSALWHLV
jgi:hypothetical protein